MRTELVVLDGDCAAPVCRARYRGSCDLDPILNFATVDGQEYFIYVTGAFGDVGFFELTLECTGVSCPAVGAVTVDTVTYRGATVSWDTVAGTGYLVEAINTLTGATTRYPDATSPFEVTLGDCAPHLVRVESRCSNAVGTSTEIPVFSYCDPAGYCVGLGATDSLYLTSFGVGGTTATSDSTTGYDLNTTDTFRLQSGAAYRASATWLDARDSLAPLYLSVWIDANGDAVFQDYETAYAGLVADLATDSLRVPYRRADDTVRMRVQLADRAGSTACDRDVIGEIIDYAVVVTGAGAVVNETCAGAIELTCDNVTAGFLAADIPSSTPLSCLTDDRGPGLWYRYRGDAAEVAIRLMDGSIPASLTVFTGGCDGLRCLTDLDGLVVTATESRWRPRNGEEYFIYVDAPAGEVGQYDIGLDCRTCPTAEAPVLAGSNEHYALFGPDPVNAGEALIIRLRPVDGNSPWEFSRERTPYLFRGLNRCTSYEAQFAITCATGEVGAWSPSRFFTTDGCGDNYCPAYGDTSEIFLAEMELESQVRNTLSRRGYTYDEDALIVFVDSLQPFTLTTTAEMDGVSADDTLLYYHVWIDLNADGDFTDSAELVMADSLPFQVGGSLQSVLTTDLAVPDVTELPTIFSRMRVSVSPESDRTACLAGGAADVADFTVDLRRARMTSVRPTAEQRAWQVLPNPASAYFTVRATDGLPTAAELYSTGGQLLRSFAGRELRERVDVSALPAGVYFLRLTDGTTAQITRVVVQ